MGYRRETTSITLLVHGIDYGVVGTPNGIEINS